MANKNIKMLKFVFYATSYGVRGVLDLPKWTKALE